MNARQGSGRTSHNTWVTAVAVAALWTSSAAWGQGGTIRIEGAIVAPTFRIAPWRASDMPSMTMDVRHHLTSTSGAVALVFTSEPNATLRATVSLLDAGGARANRNPIRVETTFTDGTRHRRIANVTGGYGIGTSGGVLMLAPKSAYRDASGALITVMTDYR
ncbi:hypothetical protein [Paraburkholderia sp. J67]|uniref:hypothetical protein n=1 Tax=Paraburkholderia sp. J67 TaxID=2805435 RepID=UPI002ABD856F|nr:hypothetical protein [Paraburkholderia sp. J67]